MRLFPICLLLLSVITPKNLIAQTTKPTIYLIPGLGTDERLFSKLDIDTSYPIETICYTLPEKGATMEDYAMELVKQMDTTKPFILIGSSLGGMLSTELSDIKNLQQTILIASAKNRNELPYRYRFQRVVPIHKLVGKNAIKSGTRLLQPIVEPDRNVEKELFLSMLDQKDPEFMKRAVEMILLWDRETYSDKIVHIHGSNDKTLPIRYVDPQIVIENGSHVMTLANADLISMHINQILKNQ